MIIIKKNIKFLCTTVTHTRQEREHNAGLTMNKEIRYQSPHEKKPKWIIVCEIKTEL